MILSRIGHFPHGTAGVDSEMNEHEGRRLRSRGRPAGAVRGPMTFTWQEPENRPTFTNPAYYVHQQPV
jgi:hypothetical protein